MGSLDGMTDGITTGDVKVTQRSPSDIVSELLELPEADLVDIILQVSHSRPKLLYHLNATPKRTSVADHSAIVPTTSRPLPIDESQMCLQAFNSCQILFSTLQHFALENEDAVFVDVIRIGKLDRPCSTRWHTFDGSAKAGVKYKAASGLLEFAAGDMYATIKVELIDNPDWDPTLEFFLQLEIESAQNADIHRSHSRCRVKIIDEDTFPTTKFKEQLLRKGGSQNVTPHLLMIEYFKMNFKNPTVRRGSIKCVAADLLQNICYILSLTLGMVLMNSIFTPVLTGEEEYGDKHISILLVIVVGYLVPDFLLHIVAFRRNYWKVAGASRMILQKNLMQAYMSYSPHDRSQIEIGHILLAIFNESPELVSHAYTRIFPLFRDSVRLILLIAFQLLSPILCTGKSPTLEVILLNLAAFIIFPIVIIPALKLRQKKTGELADKWTAAEAKAISSSLDILKNFNLIADYMKRERAADFFQGNIAAINYTQANYHAAHTNNVFILAAVSVIVVAAWVLIGSLLVLETDNIDLALFLATLKAFSDMGESWSNIYKILVGMQESLTQLTQISDLLNLGSEERALATIERETWIQTKGLLPTLKKQVDESGAKEFALDKLAITFENVTHTFDGGISLENISLKLPQGKLHAISSQRGFGKSLILQLIGKRVLLSSPEDKGTLFIPIHLKVRHVSKEPLFVIGSVYDNLVYGVHQALDKSHGDVHETPDMKLDRVKTICRELGVESKTLNRISDNDHRQSLSWTNVVPRSTQHLLNIARGLISNAEVLVLHKPFMDLGPSTRPRVAKTLRKFVDQRGLELNPTKFYHRRPRTCIISVRPDEHMAADYCDDLHWPVHRTEEGHDDHHLHHEDLAATAFSQRKTTSSGAEVRECAI